MQKKTTQRVVSTPPTSNPGVLPANNNPHSEIQNPQSPLRGVVLKETIIGAKIGGIAGEQPAVTTVNYFKGNDESKWKTSVPTYNRVNMGEVYKGIELSLKAYGNNVEKLFCVKPGGSPEQIKIKLSGVKECGVRNRRAEFQNPKLQINNAGELVAETELWYVTFTKPIAYQEIEGKRVEVECKYTIAECGVQNAEYKTNPQATTSDSQNPQSKFQNLNSEYGFTVASYDKTKPLVIDPLLASTYVGGSTYDFGNSVAIDAGGNVYVTGGTASTDFPTTLGAYQTSHKLDKSYDVFVSRLSGDLTKLLASTFLGGSSNEWGTSVAIDVGGNVYVTGHTWSGDFPTTPGAYQASNKGIFDVFVSRLDANLSAGDITPPTVVSTSPGSNAVGVALDSVITAVFSEEMDASTINASTFYLNGGVTGTVSYGTDTATLTPYSNLSNSSTYMATITTGVKDIAGNNMVANYTWSFTTVNLCKTESITAAPNRLTLRKEKNGNVTIMVKGAGDCLVEGVTVTATINGNGKRLIGVSPSSQETDANGQAVFSINAKDKKGTAVIKFKVSGLDKVATVQVKVR